MGILMLFLTTIAVAAPGQPPTTKLGLELHAGKLSEGTTTTGRYDLGGAVAYQVRPFLDVAVEGLVSPDRGERDLGGLVTVLLDRAYNSGPTSTYQHPIRKAAWGGAVVARWVPLRGSLAVGRDSEIGLSLEAVAGVGLLGLHKMNALYDEASNGPGDIVALRNETTSTKPAAVVGFGLPFTLTNHLEIRYELRTWLHVDEAPLYQLKEPSDGSRLYGPTSNRIAVGVRL